MPEALRPATISPADGRSQLADQRQGHHVARKRGLAEAHELLRRLQDQHAANEEAGQQHDRHRAHADDVHLLEQIPDIMRRNENARHGPR